MRVFKILVDRMSMELSFYSCMDSELFRHFILFRQIITMWHLKDFCLANFCTVTLET